MPPYDHSIDPSLAHFLGEFPGVGSGTRCCSPRGGPWGATIELKSRFKCVPWPGFEPRSSHSDGRERCHSTTAAHPRLLMIDYVLISKNFITGDDKQPHNQLVCFTLQIYGPRYILIQWLVYSLGSTHLIIMRAFGARPMC